MRRLLYMVLALAACGGSNPAAPSDLGMAPALDLTSSTGGGCTVGDDGGPCVQSVSGQVLDDSGTAINNLLVSVCAGACFFGHTVADGTFQTAVDAVIPYDQYATMLHGRPDRASYYTPVPPLVGTMSSYAKPLLLPSLPATGPVIALDQSAQNLTSGDVTLTLAAGTTVMLSVEDVINGMAGQQLRALTVADPTTLPFVDANAKPDALFGFAPFESIFSQKAQLSFKVPASFTEGAAVDVQQMTVLVGGAPPAGKFVHAANAHVHNGVVVMDAGEGVLGLSWIALFKQ